MMKSGTTILIVDSVEKAIKFYTEKLAFDLVDMSVEKKDSAESINYATLRKGKCFIMFRTPKIEELAEFSFVKRCSSRCVGIFAEMKKGVEKYYDRCYKKNVQIVHELHTTTWGYRLFSIKDPFGMRLTFSQKVESYKSSDNFHTSGLGKKDVTGDVKTDTPVIEKMVKYLKGFGILRRASKKYSKLWIKNKTKV